MNEIKNNGFLELSNLALTFDKIFVDTSTYTVNLIYLPINNPFQDSSLQENELKAEIIKFIGSVPAFATEKMSRVTGYLSNGSLSLNQLYSYLSSEISGKRKIEFIKDENNDVNKGGMSKVQPTLVFSSVGEPSVKFNINSKEFVIGKSADKVDGPISFNKAISRVHCKFLYQNDNYYIVDLGSANGTFVNSRRLSAQQTEIIRNGDKVRLANVDFIVKI